MSSVDVTQQRLVFPSPCAATVGDHVINVYNRQYSCSLSFISNLTGGDKRAATPKLCQDSVYCVEFRVNPVRSVNVLWR